MKAVIIIAFIALAIALWLILRTHALRPKDNAQFDASTTNVFADLRAKYFALNRTEVSISTPSSTIEPWGVIMEIGYPEVTVTTVTLADGTASVLRSSGGGFFGGGSVES